MPELISLDMLPAAILYPYEQGLTRKNFANKLSKYVPYQTGMLPLELLANFLDLGYKTKYKKYLEENDGSLEELMKRFPEASNGSIYDWEQKQGSFAPLGIVKPSTIRLNVKWKKVNDRYCLDQNDLDNLRYGAKTDNLREYGFIDLAFTAEVLRRGNKKIIGEYFSKAEKNFEGEERDEFFAKRPKLFDAYAKLALFGHYLEYAKINNLTNFDYLRLRLLNHIPSFNRSQKTLI